MPSKQENRYYEGVGRRKSSVARVRIQKASSKKVIFTVNKKEGREYLPTDHLIETALAPLEAVGIRGDLEISVLVRGGGLSGQAQAIQLGLSRALVKLDADFQRTLRDLDYLKRDPRRKERKKPGLKKARRSPQWSKR